MCLLAVHESAEITMWMWRDDALLFTGATHMSTVDGDELATSAAVSSSVGPGAGQQLVLLAGGGVAHVASIPATTLSMAEATAMMMNQVRPDLARTVRSAADQAARASGSAAAHPAHVLQALGYSWDKLEPCAARTAWKLQAPVVASELHYGDSHVLVAACADGRLCVGHLAAPEPKIVVHTTSMQHSVVHAAVSPHRPFVVAVVDDQGQVHILDLLRTHLAAVMTLPPAPVAGGAVAVAFNPVVRHSLAILTSSGHVCAYRLPAGLADPWPQEAALFRQFARRLI